MTSSPAAFPTHGFPSDPVEQGTATDDNILPLAMYAMGGGERLPPREVPGNRLAHFEAPADMDSVGEYDQPPVWRAKRPKNSALVAAEVQEHLWDQLRERQISALASAVSHPHVVSLLSSPPRTYLSLQHYCNTHREHLERPRTMMDLSMVLWVARQCEGLVDGLRHVQHSIQGSSDGGIGVLETDKLAVSSMREFAAYAHHGNIDPTTILVFPRPGHEFPALKLAYFGPKTHPAMSDHVAPEVFLGRPVSGKSDIWSLGCVFLDLLEWLMPTVSSERVQRRILTMDDEMRESFVEGDEAWRDWRRTRRERDGRVDAPAFYFDVSSGGPNHWLYTYFHDAQEENTLCSRWAAEFLYMIENSMMQSDPEKRADIQTIHDKLKQMREHCERFLVDEYATESIEHAIESGEYATESVKYAIESVKYAIEPINAAINA